MSHDWGFRVEPSAAKFGPCRSRAYYFVLGRLELVEDAKTPDDGFRVKNLCATTDHALTCANVLLRMIGALA